MFSEAALSIDNIGRGNGLFGIYVHWPFCAAKCPYCDFNSHVHRGEFDESRYVENYAAEISHYARLVPGRMVNSVFFGGGTPSLMDPRSVAAILDAIGAHWEVDKNVEVTLEANPTSVEADRFRGYKAAGINRVSLGVPTQHATAAEGHNRLMITKAIDVSARLKRPVTLPISPEDEKLGR